MAEGHDFQADVFDTIDGVHWLLWSHDPSVKYEVVSLLDWRGNETDDVEKAAGGVVKLADEYFTTFMFPTSVQ